MATSILTKKSISFLETYLNNALHLLAMNGMVKKYGWTT